MTRFFTRFNLVNDNEAAGYGFYPEPAAEISSSKLLRNIKGIIFDFDGTLFDNILLPFYLIAAYPPDLFRVRRERLIRKSMIGRDYSTAEEYFRAYFTAMTTTWNRSHERIGNWFFDHYMPRMVRVLKEHYKPRPGVAELFRCFGFPGAKADGSLSRALPVNCPADRPRIAIYSDYPVLKERMQAIGLFPGPELRLYGPETFGAQKPAVRPFLSIAADLGAKPDEVLVIGDREETDGVGAFNAGMRFFCLKTGRRRYYRLDPYRRRPPAKEGEPHGPSLIMYAGKWDELNKLLMEKYGKNST